MTSSHCEHKNYSNSLLWPFVRGGVLYMLLVYCVGLVLSGDSTSTGVRLEGRTG